MFVSAIIPAAGSGNRMGGKVKKQFLELDDKPIIAHTLLRFQKIDLINNIYLVVPKDALEYCKTEIVKKYRITKVVEVIEGGKERQDSVYNGLSRVESKTDIIIVHDGVRPFVTEDIIRESIREADKFGAVVVAIPEKDTVKEVSNSLIVNTLNRNKLWRIQTPQVFKRDVLEKAFKKAIDEGYYGTDESSLVERIGCPVRIVKGSDFNIKITTPEELILGNAILLHFS
jgi:2-C-methyl-D-erythritol 4-phosphate cytidylyltransferase